MTPKLLRFFAASLAALAIGNVAQAAIITPAGLNYGDTFRIVFVTSQGHDAISADPSVYDTLVSGLANAAGLGTYDGNPVTWQAMISTDNLNAIDRLPASSSALYLLDGTKVASSGADLWDGALDAPISINELGALNTNLVHTGSNTSGMLWAPDRGVGSSLIIVIGSSAAASSQWTEINDATNFTPFAFYAYSNELTVAVPEPSTIVLAGLGAIALLFAARRKKFK